MSETDETERDDWLDRDDASEWDWDCDWDCTARGCRVLPRSGDVWRSYPGWRSWEDALQLECPTCGLGLELGDALCVECGNCAECSRIWDELGGLGSLTDYRDVAKLRAEMTTEALIKLRSDLVN